MASKLLPNEPLAPMRWSVEKKERDWDIELREFREQQRIRLTNIRIKSKRKVAELHERVFFTVRWANPKMPNSYQKIVFDYCDHLIGPTPDAPYPKWSLLVVWQDRLLSGPEAKVSVEIQNLLERLSRLVLKRDEALVKTLVTLEEKTQKIMVAKEGDITWHMEHMKNTRDEYWTIWYLARRGLAAELSRFLKSYTDSVDTPDPDFGYTAMHYACKCNQFETFKILLAAGASEQKPIEADGRTPLHLAAAYGTRAMVLELLAVGAVYDAKDHFGATALDLARQNKNMPVVSTLENWVHLVPPGEESPRPEIDTNSVSEEYLSTPFEVLMMMSPALRVVTSRLEGPIDSSSAFTAADSGMDIGAELRLCEKRAAMCEAEGFHSESVKTKKRRWTAAKKAYQKQLERLARDIREEKEASGGRDGGYTATHTTTSTSIKAGAEEGAVIISADCSDMHSVHSVGSRSDLTAPIVDTTTIPLVAPPPPADKLRGTGGTNAAPTYISTSFLYTICLDLAETFLSDHMHEAAEVVLSDGLTLMADRLESVPRIALLKRYSQLLLFLADKHETSSLATSTASSSVDFTGLGKHSRPPKQVEPAAGRRPSVLQSMYRSKYGETDRTEVGHDDVSCMDTQALDVSMTEEEATHFIAFTASMGLGEHLHEDDASDAGSELSGWQRGGSAVLGGGSLLERGEGGAGLHRSLSHVPFASTLPESSSVVDGETPLLRHQYGQGNHTAPLPHSLPPMEHSASLLAAPYTDSFFTTGSGAATDTDYEQLGTMNMLELLRTLAPAALPFSLRGPDPHTLSVYASLQPYQQYLVRTDNCLKEAMGLVKGQCKGDFLESVELGPLLHMAAESLDR
jgi:hypothetical protein